MLPLCVWNHCEKSANTCTGATPLIVVRARCEGKAWSRRVRLKWHDAWRDDDDAPPLSAIKDVGIALRCVAFKITSSYPLFDFPAAIPLLHELSGRVCFSGPWASAFTRFCNNLPLLLRIPPLYISKVAHLSHLWNFLRAYRTTYRHADRP